jgi:hypothetical protein
MLVELLTLTGYDGQSCLNFAVRRDSPEILRALLQEVGNAVERAELLKLRDDSGCSCLHAAVNQGSPETLKALLAAAENAWVLAELLKLQDDDRQSCLHKVAFCKRAQILKALLEAAGKTDTDVRAELLNLTDYNGRSCLYLFVLLLGAYRDIALLGFLCGGMYSSIPHSAAWYMIWREAISWPSRQEFNFTFSQISLT